MRTKTKATSMNDDAKAVLVPGMRFPEFRGAEGWVQRRLGTVLSFQTGYPFPSSGFNDKKDGMRLIRNRDLRSDDIVVFYSGEIDPSFVVQDGDVLVGMDGDFTPIVWEKGEALLNQRVGRILPQGSSDLRFLLYLLTLSLKKIEEKTARTTVKHLSHSVVGNKDEPLPTLAEQRKIADCLSSLDELIAAQARKVDVLKTHKKGLMQKIFPREGETQPRFRFPEFTTAGHWKEKPFGDLLNGIIDFRGRTPAKLGMEWGGGKISSLSANNVKNGFIDYAAECNWGSEELYQRWMGGVSLQKDDIVFTMEAPLGKALLLPDSEKYILSQRVVAFKTKPAVKNPFLIQLIWSDGFQRAIDELATGSTAKGINQKALKTVLVKLPEPAEQQHIANCLSSLDTLITAATQKLETLKTHKKGLMQQLFPSPDEATA